MNIVKELRKKAGLRQQELADLVGVSAPTVSEWEHNKKDPSGERLKKLAQIFQVDELVVLGVTTVSDEQEVDRFQLSAEEEDLVIAYREATKEVRRYALDLLNLHKKGTSSDATAM